MLTIPELLRSFTNNFFGCHCIISSFSLLQQQFPALGRYDSKGMNFQNTDYRNINSHKEFFQFWRQNRPPCYISKQTFFRLNFQIGLFHIEVAWLWVTTLIHFMHVFLFHSICYRGQHGVQWLLNMYGLWIIESGLWVIQERNCSGGVFRPSKKSIH